MSDVVLFATYPYVAVLIFLIGTIYRYRYQGFKFSSLSSEFLEGKKLFWGSTSFHNGILVVLFGHLIAFLIPRSILAWNQVPLRLFILEASALAFGLLVVIGLLALIHRRLTNKRINIVTTKMDWIVLSLLLFQAVSGVWVAIFNNWGSSWFASVLSPYLWSIITFNPDISSIGVMPFSVKLHVLGAFTIITLTPFTRLVHFLVFPLNYSWRPYQQVIWYWDRKEIRKPRSFIHIPKDPTNN